VPESVFVRSADGVVLGARVSGAGSPMVLVHGTTGDKDAWVRVEPFLSGRHTVWVYDRRGRGDSADHDDYALDREVDDVLAVVAAAAREERVHLVGHSYGAICALEAAARDDSRLMSLTLYEPPFHVGTAARAFERAKGQLRSGDIDGALVTFLTDIAALSDEEVAMMRSVDAVWQRRRDVVGTVAREIDAARRLGWVPERYRSVGVRTQLLVGELTGSDVYVSGSDLVAGMPTASAVTLEGQRHAALVTAPELLANAVLRFVTADDRP
jgi:pimeloyl-ACP methyl ester carboxylesterase